MKFNIDDKGTLIKVEKCGKRDKVAVVPDGVTCIGESAFSYCNTIKKVILPKSVKIIEKHAFANCHNVEEVIIPNTVEDIGGSAFSCCERLRKISLPENLDVLKDNMFYLCKSLTSIHLPKNLKIIETGAFNGCDNLVNVTIPESVEEIGSYAFCKCESIKKMNIPPKVKRIEKMTFFYCTELKSVSLPEGVVSIGVNAFDECVSLSKMNIPSSVKAIERNAFSNCNSLKEVKIPSGLERIATNSFSGDFNVDKFFIMGNKMERVHEIEGLEMYESDKLFISEERLNVDVSDFFDVSIGSFDRVTKSIYISSLLGKDEVKDLRELMLFLPYMANDLFMRNDGKKMIDCLKNNQKEFSRMFRNLMKTHNWRPYNNRAHYYDLFKFAYTLGAFSDNQIDRQKACEFLSNLLSKELIRFENIHGSLESLNAKGFNKEWAEFFMDKKNISELISLEAEQTGYIARIYNSFDKIKEFGRSNRGSQKYRKVTVEMCIEYLSKINFERVDDTNRDIVDAIRLYTKRQESFDLADRIRKEYLKLKSEGKIQDHIVSEEIKETDVFEQIEFERKKILEGTAETLKVLDELANKKFTYEFISKYDPRNFVLGKYCSCCAHLDGVGFGIMKASILHPNCQNLIIKNNEGKIIAKSTLYVNREQGYGLFNNVEISHSVIRDEENKKMIYNKYVEAIDKFAKEYNKRNPSKPLTRINVGMGLNDLHELIKKHNKKSTILKGINFREYGVNQQGHSGDWEIEQYEIWSEKSKVKK